MPRPNNAAAAEDSAAARLTTSEARDGFAELVNRVAYGRERVVIHRRGHDLVALVPVEDLEALEAAENAADLATAREALAEHRASGEPGVPWEQIKADLKL